MLQVGVGLALSMRIQCTELCQYLDCCFVTDLHATLRLLLLQIEDTPSVGSLNLSRANTISVQITRTASVLPFHAGLCSG
jgi:hypothetical protein